MTSSARQITVPEFSALKRAGRKITMLTAYDYPTAQLLDDAGIDGILVGDSLAMVVQGRENTLPVTLEEMIYHAEMVGRAVRRALVVVDLPFPTFQLGAERAIAAAAEVLKRTRCQAVKLEGGEEQAELIARLVRAGIPVMGHCGLRPQSIRQLGTHRVERDEDQLLSDSRAVEQAGAFAVVLECVPAAAAARVTGQLGIPTIGIGAGAQCDGQILVLHDLLGLTTGRLPRHARAYAGLRETITQAVGSYCRDVREGKFPGAEQTFS